MSICVRYQDVNVAARGSASSEGAACLHTQVFCVGACGLAATSAHFFKQFFDFLARDTLLEVLEIAQTDLLQVGEKFGLGSEFLDGADALVVEFACA